MALHDAIEALKSEVAGVADRVALLTGPFEDRIAELSAALEAERAAFEEYRLAEDLEDIDQNAALEAAIAATNEKVAEAEAAAAEIHAAAETLRTIAAPAEEEPTEEEPSEEEPVDEEPVEEEPVGVEPVEGDDESDEEVTDEV